MEVEGGRTSVGRNDAKEKAGRAGESDACMNICGFPYYLILIS